jgi:histone acetyltransferase (RNA polymerase elongator complex component)
VQAQARRQLLPLVREARASALPGEIAFYGGTFTALPLSQMQQLLEVIDEYIGEGLFTGVRFSTRPDCLTPDVCCFLAKYPVRTVELGVQSLSNRVLARSRRGYTRETVEAACNAVRENHWALGIQLMLGLPGDCRARFHESVAAAIALQPDFVRIYPTLVLADTELARWTQRGAYQPLTLEQAVNWCVPAYDALVGAGISIARLGLHPDPALQASGMLLAGPNHPAFGQLVCSAWWRERIDAALAGSPEAGRATRLIIRVTSRMVSAVLGLRRSNRVYWQEKWGLQSIAVSGEQNWPEHRFSCQFEV